MSRLCMRNFAWEAEAPEEKEEKEEVKEEKKDSWRLMSEVDSHAKPLAIRSPGITGASKLIMLPQKDGGSAGMQRKARKENWTCISVSHTYIYVGLHGLQFDFWLPFLSTIQLQVSQELADDFRMCRHMTSFRSSSKICGKYRFSKALGSVSILLVNVSKLMFLSLTLRLFSSCVSQRWSHQQSRQCWQEWFDIERIWAYMAFTYDSSLVSHGQWQASLSVAVLVRREEWVVLRGAGGAGQCRTVQHHGKTSPKDPKRIHNDAQELA